MSDSWIVVGGGFSAIVGAYVLARKGVSVTIVSPKPLGGVARGVSWGGFSLDLGCHVFCNNSDVCTKLLLDLLDDEVQPVHLQVGSRFGGQSIDGFELPDLSAVAEPGQMIVEIAKAAASSPLVEEPADLAQLLLRRFGKTVSSALDVAFKKIYQIGSSEVAPCSIEATCFSRVRIVEDAVAELLKQSPLLDDRIAMTSQDQPMRFHQECTFRPYRAFYPKRDGMRGFVSSAKRRLSDLGVKFCVGEAIDNLTVDGGVVVQTSTKKLAAQHCLWTAGMASLQWSLCGEDTISSCVHGVPMVLFYFDIDANDQGRYSYVTSYDRSDLVFRASLPGRYGGGSNCPPGRAYLCCEVPTSINSELFQNPDSFAEAVWDSAADFQVVNGDMGTFKTIKTPVSYKVPLANYGAASAALWERVSREPRLFVSDEWAFSKNRIIENIQGMIPEVFVRTGVV